MKILAVNLRDEFCETDKQPARIRGVIHPEGVADTRVCLISAGKTAGAGIWRDVEQVHQAHTFIGRKCARTQAGIGQQTHGGRHPYIE